MSLFSATAATFNPAFSVGVLSPGVLNDISVFSDFVGLNVSFTYVDVGLATTPFTLGSRNISILSGYVHWSAPLSWHGLLDIRADTSLYLMVSGDQNSVIRVESRRLVKGAGSELRDMLDVSSTQS